MAMEFNLVGETVVELKINVAQGKDSPAKWERITIDLGKAHASWLGRFMEYGTRRLLNDTFSQEKGQVKVDLVRDLVREIESGEETQARRARATVTLNDVEALALANAKADLTIMFKKATGMAKLADMAEASEKVAAYLEVGKDGKASWKNDAVMAWVEGRKAQGKDYLAEAEAVINAPIEEDLF